MKKLLFLFLFLPSIAFAQGEWQRGLVAGSGITISGNTISASGGGGGDTTKQSIQNTAGYAQASSYGASISAFTYSTGGTTHAPGLRYYNAGIFGASGTLRNWYVRVDTVDATDRDTILLYKSTNGGASWTLLSFSIPFGTGTPASQPLGSDLTHTITVAPGDMVYMKFSAGSIEDALAGISSCIEFDRPN